MLSHWKMVKRIFQYLRGMISFGIFFNGDEKLIAYTDSDYGGDSVTGQSSGVLILRGDPIVYAKTTPCSKFSAEAEYRAVVFFIDDICWIRLGNELGFVNLNEPTTLCVDNRSAIYMLQNTEKGKITKGKKHIDIPRKFIQEHLGTIIKLKHITSTEQLADILTKLLTCSV